MRSRDPGLSSRRILALLVPLFALSACRRSEGAVIRRPPHEIEFSASVHADAFNDGWFMPGYHAVVWKGGHASRAALFVADVSDRQVLAALESLGGRPGNNLPMESWDRRNDPDDGAPDLVIAGPAVEVLLRLPGRRDLVALSSVLEDRAGRGFEMRFGGNETNIPRWKSGCIVCLYSCPGSKVGNASYTERDYAKKVTRFRARAGALPKDGTMVGIVLRLIPTR